MMFIKLTQTFGIFVVAGTALGTLFTGETVQTRTFARCVTNGRYTSLRAAVAWYTVRIVVKAGNTLITSWSAIAFLTQARARFFVADFAQRSLQIAITICNKKKCEISLPRLS